MRRGIIITVVELDVSEVVCLDEGSEERFGLGFPAVMGVGVVTGFKDEIKVTEYGDGRVMEFIGLIGDFI